MGGEKPTVVAPVTEPATGHVVHLLPAFDAAPSAPEVLRFGARMSPTSRVVVAGLLAIATALFVGALYILWTNETPGWWFNALFTVILLGLPVATWAGYVAAIRRADEEVRMQGFWAASRLRARLVGGRVVGRDVRVSEDGTIASFDLTIDIPDAPPITATWHPHGRPARYILQTQVPGVGAEARVWLIDAATADRPLVVEVVDPTVIPQ